MCRKKKFNKEIELLTRSIDLWSKKNYFFFVLRSLASYKSSENNIRAKSKSKINFILNTKLRPVDTTLCTYSL